MTEPDAITRLVSQAEAELGPLRVLVNNAGGIRDRLVISMSEEDWNYVWNLNLRGPRQLGQDAVRSMRRHGIAGRVINLGSVVGATGNAGQANYAAAKAAVVGLTTELAVHAAPFHVTVNCVIPGYIATDATSHFDEAHRTGWLGRIPLARSGDPDEVAALVAFLASEKAAYITGQCIAVDGGLMAGAEGYRAWPN
jgi:3-oxoacyl-[acyl-carrier protein] reductase